MADAKSWRCPFCEHYATLAAGNSSGGFTQLGVETKHGKLSFQFGAIACPNPDCRELVLSATLYRNEAAKEGELRYSPIHTWRLIPAANMRVFPDYIPAPVVADYREACIIRDGSPKAAATLARRCLQGMLRDFWKVKPGRLVDEIEAIRDRVDPATWDAIDAVRKIGNIGAHMEKDINVIIDVDPDEASLLIGLIETLVDDWYIAREERTRRTAAIVAAAKSKMT